MPLSQSQRLAAPELHPPAAHHRGLEIKKKNAEWAWNQGIPATHKITLLSFIDHENDAGESYPSAKRLAQRTCLNIKTVQKIVVSLRQNGLLIDSGKRIGKTKQVIVYWVGKRPQNWGSITPPIANPLSAVQRPPILGDGSSCKHRPKKAPAMKAKIETRLRLIVGG